MSKNKKDNLATISLFSILMFVVGVTLDVLYLVLPYFKTDEGQLLAQICIWTGLIMTAIGIFAVIICVRSYRRADRREKSAEKTSETVYQEAERAKHEKNSRAQTPQSSHQPSDDSRVTYIPSREAYDFIHMGSYQTLDEKFDQISKMDRTQFVIYVARLFSRKGYQVKLTPVIDNYDIDLLVEKMGVTIAVGCLLTNRILSKDDLVCIRNGKQYYGVSNCMALTNMYFDRSALDYAKAERMSLVDRNVLTEDFMN